MKKPQYKQVLFRQPDLSYKMNKENSAYNRGLEDMERYYKYRDSREVKRVPAFPDRGYYYDGREKTY